MDPRNFLLKAGEDTDRLLKKRGMSRLVSEVRRGVGGATTAMMYFEEGGEGGGGWGVIGANERSDERESYEKYFSYSKYSTIGL
jgi:hypothetical protein